MRRMSIYVDLVGYSWQARGGFSDGLYSWNSLILSGTTKAKDFPGEPSAFSISCEAKRERLFLTSERLEELGVPEEEVGGVLTVTWRERFSEPNVRAIVSADSRFIDRLNRHAEFALLKGIGEISVYVDLHADEFPDIKAAEDYDGIFPICDFHFVFSGTDAS